MSELHDCPKCGKKDSAWGDECCGECEAERLQWEEDNRKREQEEFCKKHGGYFDRYGNWCEGS